MDLYTRAREMALAHRLTGTASGYAAHLAFIEALFRTRGDAGERVKGAIARMDGEDSPGTVPRFRAGVALALADLDVQAHALLAEAERRYPDSTFVRTVLAPTSRAAMELRDARPGDARRALEPARPAELGTVAGLVPLYLRAEALFTEQAFAEASREYERILEHRGVDPFAPVVPLAHLGIARARARLGDIEGSRRAYATLLDIWKNADADFAPLAAARAELARLSGTS